MIPYTYADMFPKFSREMTIRNNDFKIILKEAVR
jgi:hypothetical protein